MRFFKKREIKPFISAIIAAGGSSSRMNGENKLLAEIDGIPVLAHTLLAFEQCEDISEIIISARTDMVVEYTKIAQAYGITKLSHTVCGGADRTNSVYNAILNVSERCSLVAVHDGARPLILPQAISQVCSAARVSNCAFAAARIADTVKKTDDTGACKTINRDELLLAQTPQAADKDLLMAALQNAIDKKLQITDDCMALEAMSAKPQPVFTECINFKITTQADLYLANAVIESRRYM